MFTTELGHHQKRVYLDRDGRLVVPSSASILIEGSTKANAQSGAGIINRNIGLTTSRTTELAAGIIPNSGITLITTTGVGTLRLARPVKGVEKTIVWASTAAVTVKLKVTQTYDGDDVKIATGSFVPGAAKGFGAVCLYPSTFLLVLKKYGLAESVTLVGYSSSVWLIKSLSGGKTTGAHSWTFATST